MTPTRQGSFRLFRFAGIDVYLHWSWFIVAAFAINNRAGQYSSTFWNGLEYLSLFVIVLMHEFGHALACRQVGGKADQIVLWPLGGVAYVAPPQRPGPTLWSIAAGPLVNAVLFPVFTGVVALSETSDLGRDMHTLIKTVWLINLGLLIFNLLPVYPLDGGQILRSLLWFAVGRARSLTIAAYVGFVGVAGLIALALWAKSIWFGIMSAFILMNCWQGLQHARALSRLAALPRREGFACPSCRTAPPRGPVWICGKCGGTFDTFETRATCPHCGTQYAATACPDCGSLRPLSEWVVPPPLPASS